MSTNRCKKVRSIIAMLLAVVMMTGMLPTSAFAAGEEITGKVLNRPEFWLRSIFFEKII